MERNFEDNDDNDSTIEEINSNIESFRFENVEFIEEIGKTLPDEIEDADDNYSYDEFTDNDEEINQEINDVHEDTEYTLDDFDDDLVSNITSSKEDVLFHFNFVQNSKNTTPATRTGTPASRNTLKKNLSFTSERVREIDRHNKILLKKILNKSSKSPGQISRDSSNTSIGSSVSNSRASSAAINRKRDQKKIDYENQLLMKKLQQIQRRKVTY